MKAKEKRTERNDIIRDITYSMAQQFFEGPWSHINEGFII